MRSDGTFDGLGLLFASQYINAPQVFYCPSHHGDHPYSSYAQLWNSDSGQIVINFQYRGADVTSPDPNPALLTDGLSELSAYNHNVGSNVLRKDFSVAWLPDPSGAIARMLPTSAQDNGAATKVVDAWYLIDGSNGLSTHH